MPRDRHLPLCRHSHGNTYAITTKFVNQNSSPPNVQDQPPTALGAPRRFARGYLTFLPQSTAGRWAVGCIHLFAPVLFVSQGREFPHRASDSPLRCVGACVLRRPGMNLGVPGIYFGLALNLKAEARNLSWPGSESSGIASATDIWREIIGSPPIRAWRGRDLTGKAPRVLRSYWRTSSISRHSPKRRADDLSTIEPLFAFVIKAQVSDRLHALVSHRLLCRSSQFSLRSFRVDRRSHTWHQASDGIRFRHNPDRRK